MKALSEFKPAELCTQLKNHATAMGDQKFGGQIAFVQNLGLVVQSACSVALRRLEAKTAESAKITEDY